MTQGLVPLDQERDTKVCSQCDLEKPLDEFWTSYDKRYGLRRTRNYCKTCGKKYNDHAKYKLTASARRALCEKQGGLCAICEADTRLVVDHNHETGEVRGLLCGRCNTGIGMLGDNSAQLFIAARYLEGGE